MIIEEEMKTDPYAQITTNHKKRHGAHCSEVTAEQISAIAT